MDRYKIGLLSGHRATGYSRQLSLGIQNAIVEQGHIFIKIAEQVPYHVKGSNYEYFKVAFEIAKSLDLDAYIVPASTIYQLMMTVGDYDPYGLEVLAEKASALVRSLNKDKTIILEQDIEGFRCITKDNRPGMRACMKHLIDYHGYERIAFISGPETSKGAREREGIYFEEMKAAGLDTPDELFIRGSFSGNCYDEIDRILDKKPQAVACACDQIALSVYRQAQKRGMIIGRDIAVTGFDDIVEASQADPPLSTVHITSYDLGYMAGYEAVRLAEGLPQKDRTQTGEFIDRGSCGEDSMSLAKVIAGILKEEPLDLDKMTDELIAASYTRAKGSMQEYFREKMRKFVTHAFDIYERHLKEPDLKLHMFTMATLTDVIKDPVTSPYFNLAGFQNAINAFMKAMMDIVADSDKLWTSEQAVNLHLRVARLYETEYNNEVLNFNDLENHALQIVDDVLMTDENKDLAYKYMLEEMMGSGIRYGTICLFDSPVIYNLSDTINLPEKININGYLLNNNIATDTSGANPIETNKLLDVLDKRYTMPSVITISGLIANKEVSGITIIEGNSIEYDHQVAIFLMLGFAVKHMQMISYQQEMVRLLNENNIMLTHQSQQDELTGLFNRRGFLLTTDIILKNSVGRNAAVFYLDLDGLKSINDTHGHDVGDEAIKNTADIITECFRSSDLIGRQGGDEFVAFALLEKKEDVNIIASRVEKRMKKFNEEHTLKYILSISIGYKAFEITEDSAMKLDKLMGEADEMLYEVKRKKKGSRRFEAEKER